MTCKDCIFYDVCVDFRRNICETDQKRFEEYRMNANGLCDNFKAKSRFIEVPCEIGTHLWRVTYPYKQEPKVTEFVVKNFHTVGKKRKVMLEVQAVNVPVTNIMHISAFKRTKKEAEIELAERIK